MFAASGRGHWCSCPRWPARCARPATRSTTPRSSACAGFAGALRIDLHASGRGCLLRAARVHPRRRACSRSPASSSHRAWALALRAKWPMLWSSAIERRPRRGDWSPPRCLRAGSALWNIAPDLASAISRRAGSEEIARAYARALARQALTGRSRLAIIRTAAPGHAGQPVQGPRARRLAVGLASRPCSRMLGGQPPPRTSARRRLALLRRQRRRRAGRARGSARRGPGARSPASP